MFIGQRGRESAFGWAASLVSAGILGLSMTPASLGEGPPDPPCDEPEPVVLYNADCGDLPENATPPWSTNSCGLTVGQFGTIVGDPGNLFLQIGDDSEELRAYYCRQDVFDPDCEGTQEAVFEIAGIGVFADTTPPHQIDFYLGVGLRDGNPGNPQLNGKDITIFIATTGVGFHENTGNGQDWIPGGAFTPPEWDEEAYHIYRVEKHVISDTKTEVRLFVDEAETPDVTLDYSLLSEHHPESSLDVYEHAGLFDIPRGLLPVSNRDDHARHRSQLRCGHRQQWFGRRFRSADLAGRMGSVRRVQRLPGRHRRYL